MQEDVAEEEGIVVISEETDNGTRTKSEIIAEIVPKSLIPMSNAAAMLVLGSNKTHQVDGQRSCDFELPLILLLTGVFSIGIFIMTSFSTMMIGIIFEEGKRMSAPNRFLVSLLKNAGRLLALIQLLLMIASTIILTVMIGHWQSDDESKGSYCEYGIVVFTSVLMASIWGPIVVSGSVQLYYKVVNEE